MTLTALRDDALSAGRDGFALSLGLPWIRSLPLASLVDLSVLIDGEPTGPLTVDVDGRPVEAADLAEVTDWWFIQDRVIVCGVAPLTPGPHIVTVSFGLVVPYLQVGPDGPLVLPFRLERELTADGAPVRSPVSVGETAERDVTDEHSDTLRSGLPGGWFLAASAFNWTPEVIRGDRSAPDIAVGIVAAGVAPVIEIEPGQLWRSYPTSTDTEVDVFRAGLESVGGSVSIVGASLDDWIGRTQRRTDAERLAFLLPQLQAARRVGATGVRLPIGQTGEPLLKRLLPALHELDLVLFEEIQGQQIPHSDAASSAIDTIANLDDPHLRLLVDISMLMPSLPHSYLDRLHDGGVPETLLQRLATDWRDPATNGAVVELLRSGGVPPNVHTLYMNLLVRFGRSNASDLRSILPLTGAFHLKFWDLDDEGGRVSQPIRDLAAELAGTGFTGALCSEWGGHEWVDADATDITREHLALAASALRAGAHSSATTDPNRR
jgi:hypothetical protein